MNLQAARSILIQDRMDWRKPHLTLGQRPLLSFLWRASRDQQRGGLSANNATGPARPGLA